ncbi:MAG: hypothetical protein RMY34_35545 [Aulosira sp. DedQUE10]|nr:hypothetical protein [Aulosira sp. DedQUE10]
MELILFLAVETSTFGQMIRKIKFERLQALEHSAKGVRIGKAFKNALKNIYRQLIL